MFRVTTKGEHLSQTQLTNYKAAITANIRLDDGVETNSEFELECELMGRTFRFTIPASEFASMDWTIEQMGPTAINFPNQRDYARAAIQANSMTAEERRIHTHTGWRKVDGRWMFLHAGGAICGTGAVSDVSVRLSGSMSRYELRLPGGPEALASAVKASLRLVEMGSPSISFPLLAATYRAVFGEADFALHLTGETGAFKSELAALYQQHFGAAMNRLHLPGAWSSTGNALETMAFHAKDALFVIDDFAPQGSSADIARYHAAADRVFRAAGNHAGRARLDSSARLREPKPPRALVLSTGEDIPRGQSVRAQAPDSGACQRRHQRPAILPNARKMHGTAATPKPWVASCNGWLAGTRRRGTRSTGRSLNIGPPPCAISAHARTPEIVANLQAGFEMYLEFCVASGALGGAERDDLKKQCWEALRAAATAQAKHQAATEPTARFLESLRACLSSGRAHLQSREGTMPERMPGACGWRSTSTGNWSPLGDCVGWVEGDAIYLESTAAYRVVQTAGRDVGEQLAVTEQTLRKRLHEKGLLASVDEKRRDSDSSAIHRRILQSTSCTFCEARSCRKEPDDEDNHDR